VPLNLVMAGRWLVVVMMMITGEHTCGTHLWAGFVFARGVGTASLPHGANVSVVGSHAEAIV
jgi:hypothetical protein